MERTDRDGTGGGLDTLVTHAMMLCFEIPQSLMLLPSRPAPVIAIMITNGASEAGGINGGSVSSSRRTHMFGLEEDLDETSIVLM